MAVEIDVCGPLEPPLERIVEGSLALRHAGASGLWWPDHLIGFFPQAAWAPEFGVASDLPGPNDLADPFIAAAVAAVAARPKRVGIVVTDPLRRHPASLLQSAATVAAGGTEFILGIGAGAAANVGPFGYDLQTRFRTLIDSVALLCDLRANDGPLSGDYRSFTLDGALAGIPQRRDVRIWIGGSGPGAARLAGRAAEGWLPTRVPPARYAELAAEMDTAAQRAGRPGPTASLFAWSLVAESHEAAHALLRAPVLRSLLFFRQPEYFQARGMEHPLAGVTPTTEYLPSTLTPEQADRALKRVPDDLIHEYVVHGTPAEVRAWAAEMEQVGMQHAVLYDLAQYLAGGAAVSRLHELLANDA